MYIWNRDIWREKKLKVNIFTFGWMKDNFLKVKKCKVEIPKMWNNINLWYFFRFLHAGLKWSNLNIVFMCLRARHFNFIPLFTVLTTLEAAGGEVNKNTSHGRVVPRSRLSWLTHIRKLSPSSCKEVTAWGGGEGIVKKLEGGRDIKLLKKVADHFFSYIYFTWIVNL